MTALGLGIVAIVLALPSWPARSPETTHEALTEYGETNAWMGFFGQYALRAGAILIVTLGLAVLVPLAARFIG